MARDVFRRAIGPLALLAIVGLFFREAIQGDTLAVTWDAADYSYPIMAYIAHWYRQGVVPLWASSLFNGYPLFGDPQAQTFYPVNLIIAGLTNFTPRVVYLQLILHYYLAGLFMYLLCRRVGYQWFASLAAAIAYMLSGYMVGHLSHILIYSVAWLPLLVLLLDDALARSRLRGAVVAGLAFGVSILSGPVQTIFYSAVVLIVHGTYRTIAQDRSVRQAKAVLSNAGLVAVMMGIGVLAAMIQVLPTWEFIDGTNRSEARTLDSAGFGIDWPYFVTLVAPNYFGGITGPYWGKPDITQQNLYMGIVPVFLAGLALIKRRNAWTAYLGTLALLSLLISMGTHTPVFSFFYHAVPGFSQFRNALHFLFVFHFYVALLAAEGATVLFDRNLSWQRIGLYALGFSAAAGALYLALPSPPTQLASHNALQAAAWAAALFGALLLVAAMARGRAVAFARPALVGLTALDLLLVGGHSITLGLRMSAQSLERQTDLTGAIKRDAGIASDGVLYRESPVERSPDDIGRGLFRVYVKPPTRVYRVPDDQLLLFPLGFDRAILHGLSFVDGYSPVVLRRHQELSESVGNRALKRYLELTNTQYVVVVGETVALGKVGKTLPRAFVVNRAETLADSGAILIRLADPSFDPFTAVLLEDASELPPGAGDVRYSLRFATYSPTRIEMDTESDKAGYLVLNETYYQGWHAFVDGQETQVYRANYEFKALALPAGSHRVTFAFSPRSFQVGSMATFATLGGTVAFLWWRRVRREH